jgi:catechol 2,3-dioxygenase-like lactoylglutathione lyase family enzyme
MQQTIAGIALLVADYNEAITFYTQKLGFALIADTDMGAGKRWVLVAPHSASETRLVLSKAVTPEQLDHVGKQTDGRVLLFLHTDNFWRDYQALSARGVRFLETPREEAYGTVAVFEDLYGNRWDLLQPSPAE